MNILLHIHDILNEIYYMNLSHNAPLIVEKILLPLLKKLLNILLNLFYLPFSLVSPSL